MPSFPSVQRLHALSLSGMRVHPFQFDHRFKTQANTGTHRHTHKHTLHTHSTADEAGRSAMNPVVLRHLELAALSLGIAGWVCTIFTRCLSLWRVSGTVDNTTATLPAYWDGVWLEWDHWDLQHDGSLHCSFYQSLMSLSGSFRIWRALITAAIGAGAFASVIGFVGAVFFRNRAQVKLGAGVVFVLAGILLLIPLAWTCRHTSQPLEGNVALKREWGTALYVGWISITFLIVGGGFLTTRCPRYETGGERDPESAGEVQSPLNTIHRTAFTNSQYRRAQVPEPSIGFTMDVVGR